MQDLPAEDVEEELLENGHSSLILQKSCPDQYASLKEEEVKKERKQNMGIMLEKLYSVFKLTYSERILKECLIEHKSNSILYLNKVESLFLAGCVG